MQTAHDAAVTAAAAEPSGGITHGEGGGAPGGTDTASAGPGSPFSADGSGIATERAQSSAAEQQHGSDAGVPEAAGGAGAGGGGGSGVASTTAGAAVVESCLLLDLEKKPLLKVFVFLNATEVLRAAQVCRPMFRKVGGMGG